MKNYCYYTEQINPVIESQERQKDKYKAKIKIYSGGDNIINTNYIDISLSQLKKIKRILIKG